MVNFRKFIKITNQIYILMIILENVKDKKEIMHLD